MLHTFDGNFFCMEQPIQGWESTPKGIAWTSTNVRHTITEKQIENGTGNFQELLH